MSFTTSSKEIRGNWTVNWTVMEYFNQTAPLPRQSILDLLDRLPLITIKVAAFSIHLNFQKHADERLRKILIALYRFLGSQSITYIFLVIFWSNFVAVANKSLIGLEEFIGAGSDNIYWDQRHFNCHELCKKEIKTTGNWSV